MRCTPEAVLYLSQPAIKTLLHYTVLTSNDAEIHLVWKGCRLFLASHVNCQRCVPLAPEVRGIVFAGSDFRLLLCERRTSLVSSRCALCATVFASAAAAAAAVFLQQILKMQLRSGNVPEAESRLREIPTTRRGQFPDFSLFQQHSDKPAKENLPSCLKPIYLCSAQV